MRLLAIDPGNVKSAVVRVECATTGTLEPPWGITPTGGSELENAAICSGAFFDPADADALAIEVMATLYASHAASALLETERWAGRIIQEWHRESIGKPIYEVTSSAAKTAICGKPSVKDADVRRGLIDFYGGDEVAFGRKCAACKGKGWAGREHAPCAPCGGTGWSPPRGPLHGWTGTHLFRALGVALTVLQPGGAAREEPC